MTRKILSTLFAFLCCLSIFPFAAAAEPGDKRVIVVLADSLSLEDLQQMEGLAGGGWLAKGTYGALNLRTAGSMSDVNNMITLSSGTRAAGPAQAAEAYNGEERVGGIPAHSWYQQMTGETGSAESLYVPFFPQIVEKNSEQPYSVAPGLLGQVLHNNGLKTAAYGNSDAGEEIYRLAPLLAMNESGTVDFGDISKNTLVHDPEYVYGLKSNYDYLLKAAGEAEKSASMTVIELGDMRRLYTVGSGMPERHFQEMREQILSEMNAFMSRLTSEQTGQELILFLSPMVNAHAEEEKSLMAPLVVLNPQAGRGTLFTSTTRQPDIVGNIDMAPTILTWLDLEVPAEMVGRPVKVVTEQHDFWGDWAQIKHIYSTRTGVLYGYVTLQVIILIMAAALWFHPRPLGKSWQYANIAVRFLLLMLAFSPFLFLLLPVLPGMPGVNPTVAVLLLAGTALSAAVIRLPFAWLFLLVSALNWIPVLVDGTMAHSLLMKRSYLGYDPVIGARYYGIGNEYMGVVIGSSILCFAMLLELVRERTAILRAVTIGIFGLYLVFFSLPRWGTNAGGALTAMAAYSTSFVRLFDIRLNRRFWFWLAFSLGVTFAVLFSVNLSGDDQSHSHIGRAMEKLAAGDRQEIMNIIQRKLEMNWRLIQVSSWSKVFITSLIVLGMLCWRPARMMEHLTGKYPYVLRGFFGIIIGAFTALLVNDSGIVAAATTIIYLVVPLLYLGLEEKMTGETQ